MNDPYSVLGVSSSDSDDVIKKAYREQARKYHPDNYQNNPLADLAEEKMKQINEAYDQITRMRNGQTSGPSRQPNQNTYRSGNSSYDRIRSMINVGNLGAAEQALREIPIKEAEWYFLAGSIAYRKGWMDEALRNFETANQMAPNNPEYRQALNTMRSGGNSYHSYGYRNNSCDCCSQMLCINCLCNSCCNGFC